MHSCRACSYDYKRREGSFVCTIQDGQSLQGLTIFAQMVTFCILFLFVRLLYIKRSKTTHPSVELLIPVCVF